MTTLAQLISQAVDRLQPHYPADEARAMVKCALMTIKGWTPTDIAYKFNDEVSDLLINRINEIVDRLLLDEPLQYILGEAWFHGLSLKVTPATLIPRPETSQLVDLIVDRADNRPDLRVLDIGTGSGAIAVALARSLKFARVTAIDISHDALEVARQNADRLRVEVNFKQMDILADSLPADDFDIIVSNPPYICNSEKPTMEPNVLLYEPHNALFVPDNDPLLFYRRIASLAADSLISGGMLYFEINQAYGPQVSRMLADNRNFQNIELLRDFKGNYRFISASKL